MAAAMELTAKHNHQNCVAEALRLAERVCALADTRLTDLRREVLEIVWGGHAAVKAYDIMEQLRGPEGPAKPPTVYRALRFLQERGLVHRLESLNAFVGCAYAGTGHACQFLICLDCGVVREVSATSIHRAIARKAHTAGFQPERQTIEVLGRCAACDSAEARP